MNGMSDKKWRDSLLGIEFVFIPPGTFRMDSPTNEPGRFRNEKRHEVRLSQG
jgi:formylglycine-generating enzyme required for sulfatase activity